MEILIAQVINGVSVGSIYALVVLGTNLVLLVRGVIHFAYGHLVVLGMYAAWLAWEMIWGNILFALAVGFVVSAGLTVATEPLFRSLSARKASLETIVVGLGLGIIVTEILSQFVNSGRPVAFPQEAFGKPLQVGVVSLSLGYGYTLIGAIVSVAVLGHVLYRTRRGRASRAIALDVDTARLLGIPVARIGLYSFALAGAIAGVSAVVTITAIGSANSVLGNVLATKAMVLALAAGPGNLKGGVVLALLVGLSESLALAYLPGNWTDAIVFGGIMLAIVMRPDGIFGART